MARVQTLPQRRQRHTRQPQRPPASPLLILAAGLVCAVIAGLALHIVTTRQQASRAAANVSSTATQYAPGQLAGPLLPAAPAAPDFALRDQNGDLIRLSALRGKVVALTFLYTRCPDVCGVIAGKLAYAQQLLSADQNDNVVLLAVTVDPANDTPDAVRAYDVAHQLYGANWHYLLGSLDELQPVWRGYYVGSDAAAVPGAPAAQVSTASPNLVNHTAVVYLIDPDQHVRVAFDVNFTIDDFIRDVGILGGN
jgi:protein SCO1/2